MAIEIKEVDRPQMAIQDLDQPRKLTQEEISEILDTVPFPNARTEHQSRFARDQIVEVLRNELLSLELAPSGLDEFKERLINQFEESRVRPGTMVGFAAAEAPSARFTQDNLSAVHKAGQVGMRGTGGAVGRITDLVSKQQSRAPSEYDSAVIYFSDIQTQHSIIHDKRPAIVAVNIGAVLKTEDPIQIEFQSVLFPDGVLPEWYHVFSELYQVPLPDLSLRENSKILRIKFDIEKIVEYRVLTHELRRAFLSSNTRILRFYLSPMHIGIVDVWALEEEFHSYGIDLSGDLQLDVFNCLHGFSSKMPSYIIKGIQGIRDVQATKLEIWNIMTMGQSKRKLGDYLYEYRLSSIWQMRFDWERPMALWKFLGITVQDMDSENKSWVILDGSSCTPPGIPDEVISSAVRADEEDALKYQKAAVAAGKPIVTRPVTPENAKYWAELWFAKTDGTNLRELIVRNDIDPRFTISNKPFEILELYGIVAARRVMLEELYSAFGPDTRENPKFSVRHFSLLADFVCHTGVIRRVDNLAIQPRSTLSKATFAKQFNTLAAPAIHGVEDPIGDVSSAIMVAARAKIGPSAFEYEGETVKGLTAEEIKNALRQGSRSTAEMDKLISSLGETVSDPPLYITGNEGLASAREAAGVMFGQDEDAMAEAEMIREYETSAANFPPGLEDEETEAAIKRRDAEIIIDDEDEEVQFGPPSQVIEEEEEEVRRGSRRRSRTPAMSAALKATIAKAGGVIEAARPRQPPRPVCETQEPRSRKPNSRGKVLRFES